MAKLDRHSICFFCLLLITTISVLLIITREAGDFKPVTVLTMCCVKQA